MNWSITRRWAQPYPRTRRRPIRQLQYIVSSISDHLRLNTVEAANRETRVELVPTGQVTLPHAPAIHLDVESPCRTCGLIALCEHLRTLGGLVPNFGLSAS